jgi:hypothetical protein
MGPAIHRCGKHDAIFPVDPCGGGTWIGVNTAGVAVAMLNRYDTPVVEGRSAPDSRGTISVGALQYGRLEDVIRFATHLSPPRFAPFRLVAAHGRQLAVVSSDGRAIRFERIPLDTPELFTSSSLGDARVSPTRRALFERLIGARPERWLSGQARFHNHRWSDRPEMSVLMSRPDAATVSRSTIDVTEWSIRFRYEPLTAEAAA